MNEKIGENINEGFADKENTGVEKSLDRVEEIISPQKQEELLQNIYKRPEAKKEEIIEKNDPSKQTIVSGLVKDFFIKSDKAVAKLKKLFSRGIIDASDVDAIHDKITDKNKR